MNNTNNRNIYVVGTQTDYANWMQGKLVESMEDADLVVFTGGEDVDPQLYGEKVGTFTHINKKRDEYETKEFDKAIELGKPMVAICRGAQFLTVKAGGKLIQHMNHPYKHLITYYDGTTQQTNSSHHQLMSPFNLDRNKYKIIAYAEGLSNIHLNGDNGHRLLPTISTNAKAKEPEIVYYKEINALCIQPHPEWLDVSTPFVDTCRKLLNYQLTGDLFGLVSLEIPISRLMSGDLGLTKVEETALKNLNTIKTNTNVAKEAEPAEV